MTSNRIAILAADIRRAHAATQEAEKESAKCAIEAGQALIEAKSLVKHGEWMPFLKEAGMPTRTAQRYMTLAKSGLKCDTVSYMGGIRGALSFLSKWRILRGEIEELLPPRALQIAMAAERSERDHLLTLANMVGGRS